MMLEVICTILYFLRHELYAFHLYAQEITHLSLGQVLQDAPAVRSGERAEGPVPGAAEEGGRARHREGQGRDVQVIQTGRRRPRKSPQVENG